MTATLGTLPRADEAPPAPRLVRRRRPRAPAREGRPVLRRLLVSGLLHTFLFGALAAWALDGEPPLPPRGLSLRLLATPDLVADTLEDSEDFEVPELEEIPVVAEVLPAAEPPLPEEPIEEDAPFLPALEAGPEEADLAMHELSVTAVRARTRREAPPAPAARPAPRMVPVVARAAPRVVAPAPRPVRASAGTARGRLKPLHMPRAYPEVARRMGLEGRALVLVTIGPDGRIVHAELVASAGHPILDEAALSSARSWRFQAPGETRRLRLPFRYALR